MRKAENASDGAAAFPWSGEGSIAKPYLIKTEKDLTDLSGAVNGGEPFKDTYFRQENDIALTKNWIPIGTNRYNFNGKYDGNYHIISNISIVYPSQEFSAPYVGLFGGVNSDGEIKSLAAEGKIANKASDVIIGGVAAKNYGKIINCASDISIKSEKRNCYIGGIAGINQESAKIEECFNTGEIYAAEDGDAAKKSPYAGGIAGRSEANSRISQCYNGGKITGAPMAVIGGICGESAAKDIVFCFNVGSILPVSEPLGEKAGGVVGTADGISEKFAACYYLESTSASANTLGIKKTKNEMISKQFLDLINNQRQIFINNNVKTVCGCDGASTPSFKIFNEKKNFDNIVKKSIVFADNTSAFKSGSGTQTDPYQIENEKQFYHINRHNDKHFKLIKSIILTDLSDSIEELKGSLNGGNFTVTINDDKKTGDSSVINQIAETGSVKNLKIAGIKSDKNLCGTNRGIIDNCRNTKNVELSFYIIVGEVNGGGMCGTNYGMISNCCNTGNISSNYDKGGHSPFPWEIGKIKNGGICYSNHGTISNCYNTGNNSANENAGVCHTNNGTISGCYNAGIVKSDLTGVSISVGSSGGICHTNNGTITNCYNTGNINNYAPVYIVGFLYSGGICRINNGLVNNCYNACAMGDNPKVNCAGGICGNNSKSITNCYYNKNLANNGTHSGDASGITGKTTVEMVNAAFAKSLDKNDGFAIVNHGGGNYYPELKVFAQSSDSQTKQDSQNSAKVK